MPKLESSTRSGQDSFYTIRVSKRTALEIVVAICIILGFVLFRQYEKRSATASADQRVAENVTAGPALAAANGSSQHRDASTVQVHKTAYTPEFGADDLSNSPPPDYANQEQAEPQDQTEPAVSPEEAAPANVSYPEREYEPSDRPRSMPEYNHHDETHEPRIDAPSNPRPSPTLEATNVTGAGATFPNALYQKWFAEFHELHPQVQIYYQSIGSGGGIKQLQAGTVDFAASDDPMTDDQLAQIPEKVVHIPTVLGAEVIIYNVPGIHTQLRFSPDVLADIFLGKIKTWNDPRIQQKNLEAQLPDVDITVVHHSNGSAATYIFTDYLSKISPEWSQMVHSGTSVTWPVGMGSKGCEGVSGTVRQVEGSIGYVDLVYALSNKFPMGSIQNSSGQFVAPNLQAVEAAAASARIPDDFRVSITNPPGSTAYPIAGFTWLLVPQQWRDANKRNTFVEFMNWMVDHGEEMAPQLSYVPLPKAVKVRVLQKIRSM